MPKKGSAGFTLIELLIVLVILAILAVLANINFRTLSEDQVLKKATADIQSFLRLAQSNATANLICGKGNPAGADWLVTVNSGGTSLDVKCRLPGAASDTSYRSLPLENAKVSSVECGSESITVPSTIITFAPLKGEATFGGDCADSSSSSLKIVVSNTLNTSLPTKSFNITKGGSIDVQ